MCDLFENSGAQIQKIAKIIFYVSAVLALVLGIVIVVVVGDSTDEFGLCTILGVVVAGYGMLMAYLASLFLSSYGELVQNTEENRKVNEEILKYLKKQEPEVAPAVPAASVHTNTWKCVNCGTENSSNHAMCKKCGQYRRS